jgi:ketosteroid isomerase-like protein
MTDLQLSADALTGGSARDRAAILEKFRAYLVANADMDWQSLQAIWSGAPEATFFNLNGHTYKGREQWTRLWQYYKPRVTNGVWEPFDLGGMVTGAMAVVWCHRRTWYKWVGNGPMDAGRRPERSSISRATMVFRKEGDTELADWRVVHVHFSTASEDPRPGGI